jgi:hypothetical protein
MRVKNYYERTQTLQEIYLQAKCRPVNDSLGPDAGALGP